MSNQIKLRSRIGDRGQRYHVFAVDKDGNRVSAGWTNHEDGGVLAKSINKKGEDSENGLHAEIVDRFPERKTAKPFAAKCRKCLDALMAGRNRCGYCNFVFDVIEVTGDAGTAA